jgi:hypothetical protein
VEAVIFETLKIAKGRCSLSVWSPGPVPPDVVEQLIAVVRLLAERDPTDETVAKTEDVA